MCFRSIYVSTKNCDYENISCSNGGDAHRAGGIPDRRICPEPPYNIFINKTVFLIIGKTIVLVGKTICVIIGKTVFNEAVFRIREEQFLIDKADLRIVKEHFGITELLVIRKRVLIRFKTVFFRDEQEQLGIAGQAHRDDFDASERHFDKFLFLNEADKRLCQSKLVDIDPSEFLLFYPSDSNLGQDHIRWTPDHDTSAGILVIPQGSDRH